MGDGRQGFHWSSNGMGFRQNLGGIGSACLVMRHATAIFADRDAV